MWRSRVEKLIGQAEASKSRIQEAHAFGTFWSFSQHLTGPRRIPTENTIEIIPLQIDWSHKSLTMDNRSHKFDYGQTVSKTNHSNQCYYYSAVSAWSTRFLRGAKLLFFSRCWDWQERTDQQHRPTTIDQFVIIFMFRIPKQSAATAATAGVSALASAIELRSSVSRRWLQQQNNNNSNNDDDERFPLDDGSST